MRKAKREARDLYKEARYLDSSAVRHKLASRNDL